MAHTWSEAFLSLVTCLVSRFTGMEAVVGFMIVVYIFETYLELRQIAALKQSTLPRSLVGVISQDDFEKSRLYCLDKSYLHCLHEFKNILGESAACLLGVLPCLWKISGGLLPMLGLDPEDEILHTLSFWTAIVALCQISDLPLFLYSTLVIKPRHGREKPTVWMLLWDMVTDTLFCLALGPLMVAPAVYIAQRGGPHLPIYLWAFHFLLSLVVTITPIFRNLKPLPDGDLKEKIEKLASSLNFPLKKLSTSSVQGMAADVYGFSSDKRIVPSDTLFQQSVDEIVAVTAHELGHWKLSYKAYCFIASHILAFLQIGVFGLVRNSSSLFKSFGFSTQPVLIGAIILTYIGKPLQHLVSFGLNLVSRAYLFQADAFAVKLGCAEALGAALISLNVSEGRKGLKVDPLYSAYHYPSPSLLERLRAIDGDDKKTR